MSDLVSETLDLVRQQLADRGITLGESELEAIEAQVRHRFGGERCYIHRSGRLERRAMAERDAEIAQAWRDGMPSAALAARYGLSTRRICGIANAMGKPPA